MSLCEYYRCGEEAVRVRENMAGIKRYLCRQHDLEGEQRGYWKAPPRLTVWDHLREDVSSSQT
jgi:hypothetical protein